MRMEVFENSRSIFKKEDSRDFETTVHLNAGVGEVCFSRTDRKEKQIVFDFYQPEDPVREIIDRKDLSYVVKSLSGAIHTFKEVSKNEQYHIERDEINRVILEQSENRIKWTGIIKIAFLLTSALIQLWIMKSFFKGSSVSYQPVSQ